MKFRLEEVAACISYYFSSARSRTQGDINAIGSSTALIRKTPLLIAQMGTHAIIYDYLCIIYELQTSHRPGEPRLVAKLPLSPVQFAYILYHT